MASVNCAHVTHQVSILVLKYLHRYLRYLGRLSMGTATPLRDRDLPPKKNIDRKIEKFGGNVRTGS